MSTGVLVGILALLALVVGYFLLRFLRSYYRLRGKRLVTCPETQQPAAVALDARHGATETLLGHAHLRLSECSRWPEKQGCGQECLKQIEFAPENCLVRTIVTRWYEGKTCGCCGRIIHEVEWLGHKPALMNPEQKTVYWDAIAPEQLPDVFSTHTPVCWDCHIAQTFRREHPELVIDRPWKH